MDHLKFSNQLKVAVKWFTVQLIVFITITGTKSFTPLNSRYSLNSQGSQ